jgi:ketosteroid isomerase-like protein
MASIVEEKDAIRDVLSAYCFYVDSNNLDRWAELFTEDAIFVFGQEVKGRAAIRDYVAAKFIPHWPNKHCTLNSLITINGTEAKAESYLIVVRASDQGMIVSFAGRYEDELVKQGETWRIKVRKVYRDIVVE